MKFYLPEGNQIYYYDFWEFNLANFVVNFLEPGDTFVDVGAHVGYYASLATALVGKTGTVIAIEPTPRTFESMKRNLDHFPRATVLNQALSDRDGVLTFYDYGRTYSAFNSFTMRESLGNTKLEPDEIQIPTTTLDAILSKPATGTVFIKIDAEGAESAILRGASNTLANLRPVISIEVGGYEDWDKSTEDALKLLKDSNYQLYSIEGTGTLAPHIPDALYGYDNLIAIPSEKISKFSRLMKSEVLETVT